SWFKKYKKIAIFYGWDNATSVNYLPLFLDGTASDAFDSIPEDSRKDIDKIKTHLINKLLTSDPYDAFHSRTLQPNETFRDFGTDLLRLATRMLSKNDDKVSSGVVDGLARAQFLSGLPSDIADKLRLLQLDSLEDVIQRAETISVMERGKVMGVKVLIVEKGRDPITKANEKEKVMERVLVEFYKIDFGLIVAMVVESLAIWPETVVTLEFTLSNLTFRHDFYVVNNNTLQYPLLGVDFLIKNKVVLDFSVKPFGFLLKDAAPVSYNVENKEFVGERVISYGDFKDLCCKIYPGDTWICYPDGWEHDATVYKNEYFAVTVAHKVDDSNQKKFFTGVNPATVPAASESALRSQLQHHRRLRDDPLPTDAIPYFKRWADAGAWNSLFKHLLQGLVTKELHARKVSWRSNVTSSLFSLLREWHSIVLENGTLTLPRLYDFESELTLSVDASKHCCGYEIKQHDMVYDEFAGAFMPGTTQVAIVVKEMKALYLGLATVYEIERVARKRFKKVHINTDNAVVAAIMKTKRVSGGRLAQRENCPVLQKYLILLQEFFP
ncbi:hypothetical protein FOZ63_032591, partial [Perkinsus olseni]